MHACTGGWLHVQQHAIERERAHDMGAVSAIGFSLALGRNIVLCCDMVGLG